MARSRYFVCPRAAAPASSRRSRKVGRATRTPRGTFGTASWWVRRSPVTRGGAGGGVELGARRGTAGPVQKPVALSPLTSICSRQRLRRTMSTFSSSVYAAASISSSLSRSGAGIPARSSARRELRRGQTRHLGKRPGSACSARGRAPRGCRASWQVRHAADGPERVGWSLDAMVSYSAERASSASTPGTILLPGT